MKRVMFIAGVVAVAGLSLAAQNHPQATCKGCPATYIPQSELQQYLDRAKAKNIVDQQVRSIDVGKSGVAIGMVHRGRLAAPANQSVAEHHQVSEVYHVIDGAATLVTGPYLVGAVARPATNENVRLLNGPGANAASIQSGVAHELKAGDVIVIPAGTGHWFTRIDDHISYLMIRIDPDKIVPLKDEAASKADLGRK